LHCVELEDLLSSSSASHDEETEDSSSRDGEEVCTALECEEESLESEEDIDECPLISLYSA